MGGEQDKGRRSFLKFAVTAVVAGVVAGAGGFLAGAAQPRPAAPSAPTQTVTVTQTVPGPTITQTVPGPTVTQTVTQTVTVTVTPAPAVKSFVFTVKDSEAPWALVADGVENPTIRVRVGDTVRVVFENDGIVPHTWTLDENSPSPYSVTTRWLDPGETETVEFTADRPGAYAYYCAVPGHRELGMEGQIVIEE